VPWCPYTDRDLQPQETSIEHVIPLALGGHDSFTLPVCKDFNSKLGSRLDGILANDFLIKMQRNALDVRGHSKKRPVVTDSRGKHVESGKPLHITMDRQSGLRTWCPRTKQDVHWPGAVALNFKADLNVSTQFVAKVALGAGYFAYGEAFREDVKHADLRYVMANPPPSLGDPACSTLQARVDERFSQEGDDRVKYLRMLCRAAKRSSVVCIVPAWRSFTVAVGILGDYVGLINVPARVAKFPKSDLYELGHVIASQEGRLMRFSLRQALEKLARSIEQLPVDSPGAAKPE
jgi:hypothetical protein